MLEWITANADLINVFANLGMLGIWAFYLQMLYSSFSRDRRPRLLITRGMRSDLEARCLVTNMSRDTIFIRSIIVVQTVPIISLSLYTSLLLCLFQLQRPTTN